jgi:hypothetical protein
MPVSAGQQHLCATAREARIRPKLVAQDRLNPQGMICQTLCDTKNGTLLFTNGGAASLLVSRALQRLPPTLPTGPSLNQQRLPLAPKN